jgi:hypothetical protein
VSVLGIVAAAIWWGPELQGYVVDNVRKQLFHEIYPYLGLTSLLAIAAGAFACARDRLELPSRTWVLIGIVAADLSLWLWHQDLPGGTASTAAMFGPKTAASNRISELLGSTGRFAFYDPNHRAKRADLPILLTPDFAGLEGYASVQGFGSVVDATYWDRTGSHLTRHLDTSVLEGDLADELELRLVLVVRSYLVQAPGDPRPTDPQLEAALRPPHWQEIESYGDLRLFVNTQPRAHLWVLPAVGSESIAAKVSVERLEDDGAELDRVSTPGPATLVRSVAFAEGWTALLRGDDGVQVRRPALRHGILQEVALPAGTTTIEWSYDPPGVGWGVALSLLAAGGLVAGLLALFALTRRDHVRAARVQA